MSGSGDNRFRFPGRGHEHGPVQQRDRDPRPGVEVGRPVAGHVGEHLAAVGAQQPQAGAGAAEGGDERRWRRRRRPARPPSPRAGPAPSPSAPGAGQSPSAGSTCAPTRTRPSALDRPGRRFIAPTNSATNGVAGRSYSSAGAAHCSSRPARITPTRSAIDSASSWSWVTKTVVTPSSSWMRRISSRSCSRTLASSADSGSSSSSTRGRDGERPGQRDPLLLAAGQLVRVLLDVLGEADQLEQLAGRARGADAGDCPRMPQAEGDVVGGVHGREQAVGLEDHAHVALVRRRAGDVLAVDEDLAGRGLVEARRAAAGRSSCRSRTGRAGRAARRARCAGRARPGRRSSRRPGARRGTRRSCRRVSRGEPCVEPRGGPAGDARRPRWLGGHQLLLCRLVRVFRALDEPAG